MKRAIIVVGLGFGDEGKGAVVDSLVAKTRASLVVRFNGGAQAAHHVVTPDGREHCFSQLGAGSFHGAATHLSRYTILEPLGFARELRTFPGDKPKWTVDPRALVIAPVQRFMNIMREKARGLDKHGTCGMGIGETVSDGENSIRAFEFNDRCSVKIRLQHLTDMKLAIAHALKWELPHVDLDDVNRRWLDAADQMLKYNLVEDDAIMARTTGTIIFEGAQGVLLDELWGFHPHTTWSTTTDANAWTMLHEDDHVEVIGVIRAHATRHGAGPFPTEDVNVNVPVTERNSDATFQGSFRMGHLDLPLLQYALCRVPSISGIAVTHLDCPSPMVCTGYNGLIHWPWSDERITTLAAQERLGNELRAAQPVYQPLKRAEVVSRIEHLNVPVWLQSFGPTRDHHVFSSELISACKHVA